MHVWAITCTHSTQQDKYDVFGQKTHHWLLAAGSYVDTMPSSADVIFDCIRVTWVVRALFPPRVFSPHTCRIDPFAQQVMAVLRCMPGYGVTFIGVLSLQAAI